MIPFTLLRVDDKDEFRNVYTKVGRTQPNNRGCFTDRAMTNEEMPKTTMSKFKQKPIANIIKKVSTINDEYAKLKFSSRDSYKSRSEFLNKFTFQTIPGNKK